MSQQAIVVAESPKDGHWVHQSEIPVPEPSAKQLLVKTVAFAANPTDWKHVDFKQSKPGNIAGSDASGVVVKVGSEVTTFQEGDIVSNFSHGNYDNIRGDFAEYIIADPQTTIKYKNIFKEDPLSPGDHKSGLIDTYEGAASVTLGISTVVLSFAGNLNIQTEHKGDFILIWGGATATGVLAIQIAHLGFGLKVATTASKKNHDYLKSLGADLVFDYNDEDVIDQIKKATDGKIRYALDTVSTDSTFQQVYDSTAGSPHVKADSLLFKSLSDIKQSNSREGEFEVVNPTLAYVAEGVDVELFGGVFKAFPDLIQRYNKFWFNILPTFINEIRHANLEVLKGDWADVVNESFSLLKTGKVSAAKVVFRKN